MPDFEFFSNRLINLEPAQCAVRLSVLVMFTQPHILTNKQFEFELNKFNKANWVFFKLIIATV